MSTYLFIWNPKQFQWDDLEEDIKNVKENGIASFIWSCGNTKSIRGGDRVFLMKVGTVPKGIIGAGKATSSPFKRKRNWGDRSKTTNYIKADFNILLDPNHEPILGLEILKKGNLNKQNWTPRASGISIRPELVDELEEIWSKFLKRAKVKINSMEMNFNILPTETDRAEFYNEGKVVRVFVDKYERNKKARLKCIEHFGCKCFICDFDFAQFYGSIAQGFIHVHHKNQLSTISKEYKVDPIKDLIPVCANCHSVIHLTRKPMVIGDLKKLIKRQKSNMM